MTASQARALRDWFERYTAAFDAADGEIGAVARIKREHSRRVSANARQLAMRSKWGRERIRAAGVLGLLHDVGRFTQLKEFGTLDDAASVDHAREGVRVLREHGVLADCAPRTRTCILAGVRYHNRKRAPRAVDPATALFVGLIRDADKLDIMDVIYRTAASGDIRKHPVMLLGLDCDGPVAPAVLRRLLAHRMIGFKDLRSLSDFLIMQLTWVFDMNLPATFEQVARRRLVERIAGLLPREPHVAQAVACVRAHVAGRLG